VHHVGGQGADEAVRRVGGPGLDLLVDAQGAVVELEREKRGGGERVRERERKMERGVRRG